ncbi:hypothetical protein F511_27346 [Dorcoceras hygrometricum]|uniref:CCHC-type domain-containing protein n=1 Tax=Dorcoceras hygrometricum TaxID=472368 RepID=A0A2Z7B641_9LAMI|nr:hypothetical protein F511_27346 [Dorcoceras hygrometricum]
MIPIRDPESVLEEEREVSVSSCCEICAPHASLNFWFKKKSGSGSSGSGNSSSSGSRTEFCGFCGGKHPSTQCVGVQGSCNLCGQYGHFARVCPSAGSQQTAAQPQGRGGQSRGRSQQQFQQPRFGETPFRPFQQPGPSRFGQSSQPFFPGPQHAQVNAFTREQAEETPSRVIGGNPGNTAGRGFNPAGGAPGGG